MYILKMFSLMGDCFPHGWTSSFCVGRPHCWYTRLAKIKTFINHLLFGAWGRQHRIPDVGAIQKSLKAT